MLGLRNEIRDANLPQRSLSMVAWPVVARSSYKVQLQATNGYHAPEKSVRAKCVRNNMRAHETHLDSP